MKHRTLTKKERLRAKRRRFNNKKIVKAFPFLRGIDWWGRPIKGYDYTLINEFPRGWWKAFGTLMCEEISQIPGCEKIQTQQVKEKFGRLEWYFSAPEKTYDAVYSIVDKYSVLSTNICIICGKPDVNMIYTSHISPQCRECFDKIHHHAKATYDEYTHNKDNKMANSYTVRRYSKCGSTDTIIDISETAEKIRRRYYKCLKK